MIRLNYIFLFLSSFNILYSQDTTIFAPSGATWYYSTWVLSPPPGLVKFVSEGETVLNGINAKILRFYSSESGVLEPMDNLNKYVYTSGNKVFYWVEDGFYLLYDFGAQPGDTILSRVEEFPVSLSCHSDFSQGPFNFRYVIDSLGTRIQDGQLLRVQYIHPVYPDGGNEWIMENEIIERIGVYSFASFWWGRGLACLLGGFPGELRCYEDQDIYFNNPASMFNLDCDEISSTESISENVEPIYPNPSHDLITLPFQANIVNIFNSLGYLISSYKNQTQIDVSNLHHGIYFIQYQKDRDWFINKIIKI